MNVYWLEQTLDDVPADDSWLSAYELERLSRMRFPKRRGDWRLGRWTAKRAVAAALHLSSFSEVEIRATPGGAPEALVSNLPPAVAISLSHRAGRALCVVAQPGVALGCDLELIEPRSDAFAADYFNETEQRLLACAGRAERFQLLALFWSAKESALKALQTGLRIDTRCVTVRRFADCGEGWLPLEVCLNGARVFHGWWQHTGTFVRTLVADPSPGSPALLQVASGL
jgi:4'-phosphopantetheinyl transferase